MQHLSKNKIIMTISVIMSKIILFFCQKIFRPLVKHFFILWAISDQVLFEDQKCSIKSFFCNTCLLFDGETVKWILKFAKSWSWLSHFLCWFRGNWLQKLLTGNVHENDYTGRNTCPGSFIRSYMSPLKTSSRDIRLCAFKQWMRPI